MVKNEKKEEKNVRVALDAILSQDLEDIKKYYGIVTDTEIIRYLIRMHKKEIMKREDYNILLHKNDKI